MRHFDRHAWPALFSGALVVVSFAAILWVTRIWPDTPDGLFHLHRVRSLSEALRTGVLYPRWFPDFAFGHGYPVFHYYSPAFYYPAALLHLAGADPISATRVTAALAFALSGGAMLLLLRRLTGWGAALLGATLYLAYPYRLYDLLIRGALPEFAAFFWLPIVVLGGYTVAATRGSLSDRWSTIERPGAALLLTVALTGLIVTHNLTAMMAVAAGAVGWLARLAAARLADAEAKAGRGRRLTSRGAIWTGVALATAVMLSAPYALPALLDAQWVSLGAGPPGSGYANHFAAWRSLWTWAAIYPYPTAADPVVPVPAYVLMVMTLALVSLLRVRSFRTHVFVTSVVTFVALFLMTMASEPIWQLASAALGRLQFPWRWHAIVALSISVLAALLVESAGRGLPKRSVLRTTYWGLVGASGCYVVVYALAGLPSSSQPVRADELTVEQMWEFDAQHGQVGATWTHEFLPKWVAAPVWAIGRDPDEQEAQSPVAAAEFEAGVLQQGYLSGSYQISSAAPLTLTLQSFYFPAWRARVDGAPVAAVPCTSLGLLSVPIPAGDHRIDVEWGATPAVVLGRASFVAGWLVVLWLLWLRRPSFRSVQLAGWAAVAGLFVLVVTGWTGQEIRPSPMQADYGAVTLVGATTGPAVTGGSARVRLYWSVTDLPEPLTAFVHVVDERGRVVAQNDSPLGGPHFPPSRWIAGLIFQQDHVIPIPDIMQPGRYQLLAGLYRPGQPDTPLVALGREEPRVEVGILEVVP